MLGSAALDGNNQEGNAVVVMKAMIIITAMVVIFQCNFLDRYLLSQINIQN